MISRETYIQRMGEAILLTNSNLKRPAQDLIYDRICKSYTNADFLNAIEEVSESDTFKISYPVLVKRLNHHRAVRHEMEAKEAQEKELEEAKKFWDNDGPTEECVTRRCGSCDKHRCGTMAKASVAGMEAMFKGEISLKDLLAKLADDFPGAGFEGPVDLQEWKAWKAQRSGKKTGKLSLASDDDFIPELEVHDDDVQGTLNLDRPPAGHA